MSETDAAQTQGEEQLLAPWRKVKQSLKETKMHVTDTRKHDKEFECAWESASGGKAFRSKVAGGRGESPCQIHQEQKQRNLGHDESETEVRTEKPLIPQDREWKTDTKQAVSVIKRTELTSSRTRDGKPEKSGGGCKPETIFPEPCGGAVLVTGSREESTRLSMLSSWKECRR